MWHLRRVLTRINLDRLQAAHATLGRHFPTPGDFLFQESLLYTSIPKRLKVSARISLRGLPRLVSVNIVYQATNVGLLAEWLNIIIYMTESKPFKTCYQL